MTETDKGRCRIGELQGKGKTEVQNVCEEEEQREGCKSKNVNDPRNRKTKSLNGRNENNIK